jgi:ParB-like chromosome segregation protein Spo0J
MAMKLLECDVPGEFSIKIGELIALDETGFPDAHLAMRDLVLKHLEVLIISDPREWPPVVVTKVERDDDGTVGYVLVDGYHRKSAAVSKQLTEVRAICKSYETPAQVVEAAFEANMRHGLAASAKSRSNYAYWLSKVYPDMTQEDIGRRAGITQPAVSVAIRRRKAAEKKAAKKASAPAEQPREATPEEKKRDRVRKSCRSLTRDVSQLLEEMGPLDEQAQRAMILDSVGNIQERDNLLRIAHLLQEVLEPPKQPTRRPASKKG